MPGTLTVSGMSAGLLSGEKITGPLTMAGKGNVGGIVDQPLVSGDNTIAVPANASAVLMVMPSSNGSVLKLRTNLDAADVGVSFGPNGWLVMPLASGTTSLIINAPGTVAAVELTFI